MTTKRRTNSRKAWKVVEMAYLSDEDSWILAYAMGFNDPDLRGDSTYDDYIDAVMKKLKEINPHAHIRRVDVEQRFNDCYRQLRIEGSDN